MSDWLDLVEVDFSAVCFRGQQSLCHRGTPLHKKAAMVGLQDFKPTWGVPGDMTVQTAVVMVYLAIGSVQVATDYWEPIYTLLRNLNPNEGWALSHREVREILESVPGFLEFLRRN